MKRRWARWRDRVRENRVANILYRIGVAIVGGVLLVVGILAIPFPGPGWALLLVALAVLATEFDFAKQLLVWARERHEAARAWFRRQNVVVRSLTTVLSVLLAVALLWLLGVVGWLGALFGADSPWLRSPIGVGS